MRLVRRSTSFAACLLGLLLVPFIWAPVRAAGSFTVALPLVTKAGATSTIYVAKTPNASSGANCGTSATPCALISDALDKAKPGDTISVGNGVYVESLSLEVNGTPDKPITLRAEQPEAATIKPPSARTVIDVDASYWVIEGFEITPGGLDSSAVSFNQGATNNILRGNTIHSGQRNGVELGNGSSNNQILNNRITNFRKLEHVDAHGIAIKESHNNLIEGNSIFNNSGDAVQVFTIDTPAISQSGRSANNNRIINNKMYANDENAVDVKSSKGTVISDNEMWDYKPALERDGSEYRSDGMAISIHYWARDVIVSNNIITDSTWGIEVSRGEKGGVRFLNPPTNVKIHNNYIANITMPQPPYPPNFDTNNKGNGAGIVVRESDSVQVFNNTVVGAAGYCFASTWPSDSSPPAAGPPTNLQLLNNSFSGCQRGDLFLRNDAPLPNIQIDYNHYGSPVGGRLFFGSKELTLLAWQAAHGFDLHGLTTVGSGLVNTQFQPETSLIDRGKEVGLPFCGTAPDIGAFEAGC